MSLYSDPPPYRDFAQDKPTLLVCWWITIFCCTIILLRIGGRFVRSETLFTEDKIAALALIPLFTRMACVHVVLLYGTNNADFTGLSLTAEQRYHTSLASRLVLVSRIMHAATLWILKSAILEFFKRLSVPWKRSYRISLLIIRVVLAATFLGVVISALGECRPFEKYWQVLPDPGPQCRQGYAHLITLSVCNIMTDLLLVFFPSPIIIRSAMTVKRKVQLVSLFSLSLAVVIVTIYRLPIVISHHGSQQTRSLMASIELLFATAASNSLVLGTFVRDRGTKKRRFKYGSIANESIDRSSNSRSRRPTMVRHWGSDEDLVRDLGLGVQPELRDSPGSPGMADRPFFHPAPLVRPDDMENWQFPVERRTSAGTRSDARSESSLLNNRDQLVYSSRSNSTTTPRKVSFFDVGGLLAEDTNESADRPRRDSHMSFLSHQSGIDPLMLSPSRGGGSAPSPTLKASSVGSRRGSTALLQDLGGLFGSLGSNGGASGSHLARGAAKSRGPNTHLQPSGATELEPIPQEPRFESSSHSNDDPPKRPQSLVLHDLGGLLGPPKKTLVD